MFSCMPNTKLSIELFTQNHSDIEKKQYQIRAVLQNIEKEFQFNRLYPHLSRLIDVYRTLDNLAKQLSDLRSRFPKRIKKIDFVNQKLSVKLFLMKIPILKRYSSSSDGAFPTLSQQLNKGKRSMNL